MNLKWDEDADIFHKTEGIKPIGADDVTAFNKIYNDELNAKMQKDKDAADKLEKKMAKAAEAGKESGVIVKGPTVLQRGTFKRGEKAEKETTPAQDENGDQKDGQANEKGGKREGGPDGSNKGQKNDKGENQGKKGKKEKDQSKNQDDSSNLAGSEQNKEGRKGPQKGPNPPNPNKQPKKEQNDPTGSQKNVNLANQDKSSQSKTPTAEGGDQKVPTNQKKKKPKNQAKKQPPQPDQGLLNQGQFMQMNFDPSIVNNFQPTNMGPQGFYPHFQQGGFQMRPNAMMSPNFPGREDFYQQDASPYDTAKFYPNLMQQLPFYGRQQSRGSGDNDFNQERNFNNIDERQLKQMLNLDDQNASGKQNQDIDRSKGNSK